MIDTDLCNQHFQGGESRLLFTFLQGIYTSLLIALHNITYTIIILPTFNFSDRDLWPPKCNHLLVEFKWMVVQKKFPQGTKDNNVRVGCIDRQQLNDFRQDSPWHRGLKSCLCFYTGRFRIARVFILENTIWAAACFLSMALQFRTDTNAFTLRHGWTVTRPNLFQAY